MIKLTYKYTCEICNKEIREETHELFPMMIPPSPNLGWIGITLCLECDGALKAAIKKVREVRGGKGE